MPDLSFKVPHKSNKSKLNPARSMLNTTTADVFNDLRL